jgi:chemotaxis signal transduction protein
LVAAIVIEQVQDRVVALMVDEVTVVQHSLQEQVVDLRVQEVRAMPGAGPGQVVIGVADNHKAEELAFVIVADAPGPVLRLVANRDPVRHCH